MKRIRYIMPVESMSGLLGTKQDLRYAENDNKAFESPAGHVNYARNYQPGVVAARVARTGLKYFAIKTKTAFKATAKALKQCAVMGASSAIYGISIADAAKKASLDGVYALAKAAGYEGTFHKFVTGFIRTALESGAATIVVAFQGSSVNLGNNPFSEAETAIAISSKLLVKFWNQLTPDGISFLVAGEKGIWIDNESFDMLTGTARLNVLNLSSQAVSGTTYMKKGDLWLLNANSAYVDIDYEPADGEKFTLTDVAPSA